MRFQGSMLRGEIWFPSTESSKNKAAKSRASRPQYTEEEIGGVVNSLTFLFLFLFLFSWRF